MKLAKKILPVIALLSLSVKANALEDIYVVQFVLDGVNKAFIHEQIEKGELPNLKARFFEKGAIFDNAITTFPTVSSPGYVSFTTGLSAGNSGIFFLEWFDRTTQKTVGYLTPGGSKKVNSDLTNHLHQQLDPPTTLFERLSPEPTAAIYTPFRKGATIGIPKRFPISALWSALVTKDGLALNKLAMKGLNKVFSQSTEKIPRYTLVGLYGTDFYGHHDGPNSEEVLMVLKQFDTLFKNFSEKLKKEGLEEKTVFIITADHGMHTSGQVLKLRDYLKKRGVGEKTNLYVGNRGVSSTFIYAGTEEGWGELPRLEDLKRFQTKKGPVNLIHLLLKNESVDWLAARENLDHVHVFDRNGEGEIRAMEIGGKRFYTYTYYGEDPLQFAQDPNLLPLLNGTPYSQEIWLQKTFDAKRPNGVVELSQLFQDPRAGDILVVAKDPWSFRKAKVGTHGSLHADDMAIPLWIAGEQIPQGHFGAATRGVDLYPTVLSWFGLSQETDAVNQEGRPLFAITPAMKEEEDAPFWLAKLEQELMRLPSLSKLPDQDEIVERLRQTLPGSLKESLMKTCKAEIDLRYQRWKEFEKLPTNWLLANEKNMEFLRLRRMEDIESILKNP